jgi:hypothetical protein
MKQLYKHGISLMLTLSIFGSLVGLIALVEKYKWFGPFLGTVVFCFIIYVLIFQVLDFYVWKK